MSIEQENLLDNIFDQASKCDRCGACLLVCPVLKVNGKEMCSPRGMINASIALKQQSVATKEAVGEVINYCLLCGACVDVCPSKVNIPEVLLKTREYLFNEQALRQPKVIDDHEQLNNAFENLCTLTAQRQSGQAKTIAYFFSYEARRTDINAAAKSVALLSTIADVELVNNDDAGFSAIALGDLAAARQCYKNNIQLFEDYDVVVVDSAVSYSALKNAANYFKDMPEWQERAALFSKKIYSLTEYLVQANYQTKHYAETITYHECYHLGRLQGIKKEPRTLLKQGGNFVEMEASDLCCTGHSPFNLLYPQAAEQILKNKAAQVLASNADIVVTECYECLEALKKVAEKSTKLKAQHISEIL